MSAQSLQLGIFGTFDVENYGDLLFPLIAEAELQARLGPLTLHKFSYHDKSPRNWPYAVSSLTRLPGEASSLDGVIVGGGHVIRFDKAIARGYRPPSSAIHHPTGYWLTPALIAQGAGLPVIWNAPGVHGDIPGWAEPLMALAINTSAYVSVRDEPSRRALEPFATDVDIGVVPDTAFGVARLVDVQRPSADFLRARAELGSNEPYIVVQATSALRAFARAVRSDASVLRGHRVLVLPVCPIHGDHEAVFDRELPDGWRLGAWPHPLLLAELIAHASAVVGVSLHLSITALAFGVPLYRPADSFGGKYAILSGYEGVYRLDTHGGADLSTLTAARGARGASPSASRDVQRLAQHWDAIATALTSHDKADAQRRAMNRFWSRLPAQLEGAAGLSLMQVGKTVVRDLAARQVHLYQTAARKPSLRAAPRLSVVGAERTVEGNVIDFARIAGGTLATRPYEWAFIDQLFAPEHAAELSAAFPRDSFKTVRGRDREKGYAYEARALVHMGAKVPAHAAGLSPAWRRLADDLLSPAYRDALSQLLGRDIRPLPMEVNVFRYPPRAWLGPHVDLKDKLITHVFYFNDVWDERQGGCLNVLWSRDMADAAASVPPLVGHSALLVRSENSWHAVSRVVRDCTQSRLSMTVTFYKPGSVSTLWPPGDTTALHTCEGSASWGASGRAPRLWASLSPRLARLRSR